MSNLSQSESEELQLKPQGTSKEFCLDIFVEKQFYSFSNKYWQELFDQIRIKYGLRNIQFKDQNKIPELEGVGFTFEDPVLNKKCDALNEILQSIENSLQQLRVSIILLIPEGVVSYLIGAQGRQINSIMKDTNTEIVVNQPIYKFAPRTVRITGQTQKINLAVRTITQKISERGVTEEDYKGPEPFDTTKITSKVKLLFPRNVASYIKDDFDQISQKNQVSVRISISRLRIRHLRRDDEAVAVQGKLNQVLLAVTQLLKRAENYYIKHQMEDPLVKIIMPSSFASKLIGAKGCMIRELVSKSKGAQIKVMSEKNNESDSDCLVRVSGSLLSRQEATCLILEQIECFRYGGPILESGKFINENFAQQCRNSVTVTNEPQGDDFYDHGRLSSSSKKRRLILTKIKIISHQNSPQQKRISISSPRKRSSKSRSRNHTKDSKREKQHEREKKNDKRYKQEQPKQKSGFSIQPLNLIIENKKETEKQEQIKQKIDEIHKEKQYQGTIVIPKNYHQDLTKDNEKKKIELQKIFQISINFEESRLRGEMFMTITGSIKNCGESFMEILQDLEK